MSQKDSFNLDKNDKLLKKYLKSDSESLTRDDLLDTYYYPILQDFIDGKIQDLNEFFSLTPGRFLLRFLMDRFSYHTDNSSNVNETFYCCDGKDISSIEGDGGPNDFLKTKEIMNLLSEIKDKGNSLRKCDRCIHRYYCGLPSDSLLKENNVYLIYPEDRCYITKSLFRWYENHMNSILKVIYNRTSTHSVKFKEDKIYCKILNDRLNSKYFVLEMPSDKTEEFYNFIIVRLK